MNTQEIKAALKNKYDPKAHALLFEVGNSTGFACGRHADAVAMSLWPSRGLELIGHEIKASRNDWLRELKNPAKAEPIFKFCDRWYVVAGGPDVVKQEELPSTWGLMIPRGSGLIVSIQAPKLEPQLITRSFLAALLRRVNEQSVDAAELQKAKEEGQKIGEKSAEASRKYIQDELDRLQKQVDDFENASGIRLGRWDSARNIGAAVKLVLSGRHNESESDLRTIRHIAQRIIETADEHLSKQPDSIAG